MSHSFNQIKSPALPGASMEYSKSRADSHNNVLRLYFNRVDAAVSDLQVESIFIETEVAFNRRYSLVMA